VFLLPSLALGLVLALALGGRPARIGEIRFRAPWLVLAALAVQAVLFSRIGDGLPEHLGRGFHLATYAALAVFAALNLRVRALGLVLTGMLCNAAAILANGGEMPVSRAAARAAGISLDGASNVSADADRLWFLGDVFAIPAGLPLANAFSIGDVLIGLGAVAFIVLNSLGQDGERTLRPRRLVEPLGVPDFRRLAVGRLVTLTGDWLTTAALVAWLYAETHSVTSVAVLLLVRLAPRILGGGAAAVLVDRVPKRLLLVSVELGRGLAVLLALAGVATGLTALVFAAIAISGLLAAISEALVPALVPSLVPERQYASANALLGTMEDAAMVVGSLGAGIAVATIGAGPALAIDALTFVAAAVVFATVRIPGALVPSSEPASSPLAGLRYLLGRRRLLVLVLAFAAATLATGLANVSLPRLLDDDLGVGPGAYGFAFAALGAGLAVGKCCAGFARVGANGGRWMGCALLLMAVLFALLASGEHAATALLLLAAIGVVDGTTDVVFDTVVQQEAEPSRYGSVFGFASAAYLTTMMGAVAFAPALNSVFSASGVLLVGCVSLVVAGTISLVGLPGPPPRPAPRAA
jgi:DHA3 family macrolide efflux protein-like MFS transporter